MGLFKKLIVVGALAAGAKALTDKRKKQAEAEAKLWDEATGRTTPPPATPASS